MKRHTLMVLDPGHFHAALPLKWPNPRLSEDVHVFAPEGDDLDRFVNMVESFNRRADHPTAWRLHVRRETDSLQTLLRERPGDLTILAGRNDRKSANAAALAAAGLHVLADKPLAIDRAGLAALRQALAAGPVVADLMTARQESYLRLQRELTAIPEIFGDFDPDDAISIESTHCLSKQVAGNRLVRPAWYFDVRCQGVGIVDVATHYVDLVFQLQHTRRAEPVRTELQAAASWPTLVPPHEFQAVTGIAPWPEFLRDRVAGGILRLEANGEILFRCNDLPVRLRIDWRLKEAPGIVEGINFCCHGRRARIAVLRQPDGGPILTVAPENNRGHEWDEALRKWLSQHPGMTLEPHRQGYRLLLPPDQLPSHEEQFTTFLNRYLDDVDSGSLPEREKEWLLAKYDLLTAAAEASGGLVKSAG